MAERDAPTADKPLSRRILHALKNEEFKELSEEERLEVYLYECRRIGLDPASQPLAWGTFSGKLVLYAKRKCGDMLATKRGISTEIIDGPVARAFGKIEVLFCRVRATMPDGRHVDDVGTVAITEGANGVMKVVTKATRRATLRLCGWGGLDESEIETIPGARKLENEPAKPGPLPEQIAAQSAPQNDPPLEPCDAMRAEIKQAATSPKPGQALTALASKLVAVNDPVVSDFYAETWVALMRTLPKQALPKVKEIVSSLPNQLRAAPSWADAAAIFEANGLGETEREPGSDDDLPMPRDAA